LSWRIFRRNKFRGEKIRLIKKKYREVIKPYRREKHAINELQDHILNTLGGGYFSKLPTSAKYLMKVLGWAAGEDVSDMDVYSMLREIATENGLFYEIPAEDKEAMRSI